MRTGRLETDLAVLGSDLAYVPDLIAAEREAEHARSPAGTVDRLATDVPRLRAELEAARDTSALPDHPDSAAWAPCTTWWCGLAWPEPCDPLHLIAPYVSGRRTEMPRSGCLGPNRMRSGVSVHRAPLLTSRLRRLVASRVGTKLIGDERVDRVFGGLAEREATGPTMRHVVPRWSV
jgi:hypothetical protein